MSAEPETLTKVIADSVHRLCRMKPAAEKQVGNRFVLRSEFVNPAVVSGSHRLVLPRHSKKGITAFLERG